MHLTDAEVYSTISEHQNPAYVDSEGYEIPRQQVPSMLTVPSGKDNSGGRAARSAGCRPCVVAAVALATAAVVLAVVALGLVMVSSNQPSTSSSENNASALESLEARLAKLDGRLTAEVVGLKAKVNSLEVDKVGLEAKVNSLEVDKVGLEAKVNSLEVDKVGLKAQVKTLEEDRTLLQFRVQKLEQVDKEGGNASISTEISGLKGRVESLEAEKGQLKAEVSGLRGRVDSLDAEKGQLKADVASLVTNKTRLESKVSALEARLANTEAETSRLAAQLANVTSSAAAARVSFMTRGITNTEPANQETLVFPDVRLNQGSGYDNTTGVFTAPTSGVYAFLATLQGRGRQAGENTVFVGLVKDGAWQTLLWTQADREDDHDATSLTAVLRLSQGQRVWLRASGSENRFYGGFYTAFSGILIHT